jgi:hypothetical protein
MSRITRSRQQMTRQPPRVSPICQAPKRGPANPVRDLNHN